MEPAVEGGMDASSPLPLPRMNGSDASMQPARATAALFQQQHHQHYYYPYHDDRSGSSNSPELYRDPSAAQGLLYEGQTAMQHPPQYAAGHSTSMNGAHMQPPPAYAHPYHPQYANGATMQPAPTMPSNGQPGVMRYAIPPQAPLESRQMSGVRGKKEIKRRTKTGCLTCRKRRIKCDERQPHCRNCEKSKRECLGYDPVFKQQQLAPIQPAPASSATPTSNIATHALSTPTLSTHPYAPSNYPATGPQYVPSGGPDAQYEYSAPLDPALSGGEHLTMAHSNFASSLLHQPRKINHVAMDDLFSLDGIPPQYQQREVSPSLPPLVEHEVGEFYSFHFAQGLDKVFETSWYSVHGLSSLQTNSTLKDFVAQCVEAFKAPASSLDARNHIRSLEARLVWQLAIMPRSSPAEPELVPRIAVVESLLTGQILEPSHAPVPPEPQQTTGAQYNLRTFWYHLGRIVSARDDRIDYGAASQINDSLAAGRSVLNQLENRDVLYSIAIARHLGGRMPDFHPGQHLVATTNDANEDINKLKVAHHFIEVEDQKGTTQVIQRICSMALRSWILQKQ